jgi:hypothetical protein
MPATPSRIGFITQQFRIATAGPDSAVEALYGNAARDTPEPLESFFDDVADAEVLATERLDLLKVRRNLVTVSIDDAEIGALLADSVSVSQRMLLETDGFLLLEDGSFLLLDPGGELALSTVRIIDDEQDRNSLALVVGVAIDMARGRTTLETWG